MTEAVLKGLGLGLILAMSVGPVIFTIIKQSLNNGREGGFSFVAGVWASDILLVIVSNAFSALVTRALEFRNIIGYFGATFLIGMGIYFAFFKKVVIQSESMGLESRMRKLDMAKIFTSGFLINTLNPSVLLFWLINATAFAVSQTWEQRVVIFGVCLGINIVADILKVLMAGSLRSRLTPHTISIINKISGTILIIFGAALIYGIVFMGDKLPG
jgi:threonine/homoserine/homoserine lactone efflux protein